MNWSQPSLPELAARVSQGDTSAADILQEHLQPNLERMVRRVLRHGPGRSRVGQAIHKALQAPPPRRGPETEMEIARRLGQGLVCQLQAGSRPDRDTFVDRGLG